MRPDDSVATLHERIKAEERSLLAWRTVSEYTVAMNFEWDEQKNQSNVHKHGLSFADAWEMFQVPMLIEIDDRMDYGEERWIGIGRIRERTVVAVFTAKGINP